MATNTSGGKRGRTTVAYGEMTPFAQALQDWMWYENKPPMLSRTELSDRLRIARTTVDTWFRAAHPQQPGAKVATIPQGRAWYAVLRLTGWDEATMLRLTNYRQPPDYAPDAFDFALEWIDQHEFSADFKAHLRQTVEQIATDYARTVRTTVVRRPARRAGTPGGTASEADTPAPAQPREREKAHSGK